jgi:PAS domain S-box-containing protein
MEKMQEGKPLVIHTERLPPEAARDQEMRRHFGVKTSVGIPLSIGAGRIIGFISFDNLKVERNWPEAIVKRFELIGQIFANALIRKQSEEKLASIRRIENLVAEISARFINLPSDRIDAEIENAQRRVCDCMGMDLSALWQWSDNAPHFMTITHLHSPPDGPERPVGIDAREAFPWALERLLRGEELVYSTNSMPPEATRDIESRRHYSVKSSVNIPLSAGGGPLIGILSFDTLKAERSWSEPVLEKLRLVAQTFANAMARKRSDLQLRESRARLRMATESAGVGLWVMEAETGSVWVTSQTRALFQFDEDEVLDYASFDRKISSEDRKRVKQGVQNTIRSGDPLDIDFRVVLSDDSVRWIRASGKSLPGTHGQGVRLMGASKDITQHKQMEEKLRNQLAEIEDLKQQLEKENIHLRKEIELQYVHEEIVSRSTAMKQVLSQVEQVARTDATVLIEGETGTGKELLARAVHRLSGRKDRPLVTVNCASLPPTLVESELFGREKGAYTGALTRMTGRFEMADGATLFLDEIGEMPLDVQAKLLRVLEQGKFERLGSTQSIRVDVRIIAATNQNLADLVGTGKFRKDLYYRLNVFPIHLPPLRERPEDIPSLVWAFIRQYEKKMGRRIDHMPRQCMDELQRYDWPGNVRELRNVIERALIVCSSRTLAVHPPNGTNGAAVPDNLNLEEMERRHILSVLEHTGWRLSGPGGAAELLGLKRTTLQSKMKRLGIQRPQQ